MSNDKYDGLCATCFVHKFPTDPRSKRAVGHIEELAIVDALTSAFGAESFKREHRVDYTCVDTNISSKFASIDFMMPFVGTGTTKGHVFLEVDEQQHNGSFWAYSQGCETTRMANVVSSLAIGGNTAPIAWVRYNPHGFKADGIQQRTSSADRQAALIDFIQTITFDECPAVRVFYMFYDTEGGMPCVLGDAAYQPAVREWYAGLRA